MQDDRMRLRTHLACQRRRLHHLDLVEHAERLLRRSYELLLMEETIEVEQGLRDLRRSLPCLQRSDRLVDLLNAEDECRALGKRLAWLRRRGAEEQFACRRARTKYVAQRALVLRSISQLQRLLQREAGAAASQRQTGSA